MPSELWPNECDHVEYSEVYKATKHANELGVDDFLPWNIEHHNQMKTFKNQFEKPRYGLSLFTNLESLKNKVDSLPVLNQCSQLKTKGI